MSTVFDQVNDAVIVADTLFAIQHWSRGAERLYGWSADEVHGRLLSELIPVERYLDGGDRAMAIGALHEHDVWSGVVLQRHRNGGLVYVESSIRMLRQPDGAPIGVVSINRDVTERLRAEEQRAAAQERLLLLAEVAGALAELRLDLAATLATVARLAAQALADGCVIALLDADQQLAPAAIYHRDAALLERLRQAIDIEKLQIGKGVLGQVVATGQPLLVDQAGLEQLGAALKPAYRQFLGQSGVASIVAVPLRAYGQIVGAMLMARDRPGRAYTADDHALLQELADRSALAIEHARLFAAERAARSAAEQAAQQMAALQTVTAALAEVHSLEQVFAIMLDLGISAAGAQRGGIGLLTEDGTALRLAQAHGFADGPPERWQVVALDRPTLPTDAIRERRPLFIGSLEEKRARYPHLNPHSAEHPVQAALPLLLDTQVVGVLLLVYDTPQPFGAADRRFLEALAQQASYAVERMRLAERELHERQARHAALAQLSTLLATAPIGICFWDQAGVCLQLNDTFAALSGQSIAAQIGRPVEAMAPDVLAELAADVRAVLATGEPLIDREVNGALPASGQALRHWLTSVYAVRAQADAIIGVGAMVVEITARKQLEAQLLQAQKMESIGRLAGGIAHDFNNLLTVIQGYAEMIESSTELPANLRSDLGEIQQAAARASELTRQLLAFARKQVMSPQIINLNKLIVTLDKLLRRLIGEHISFKTLPAANLDLVRADPGQIEQVLINLAVNARDAMPQGGQLTIETQNVRLGHQYAGRHAAQRGGQYVLLAVSDTGVGMDAATKEHAFEPFFTTKEAGKGTGLGLSTCYGLVKQHGGNIWIYSEPGRGTTVKVYLPRAEHASEDPSDFDFELHGQLPLGSETVLVAEDEAAVRQLAARVLRAQGYTVLEAANGDEAVRVARSYQPAPIDLLLTDVVMPGQVGTQVAAALAQIYPAIKVLYTSGYTENAIVHHNQLDRGVMFITKPFTPTTLAQVVRKALDG